MQRPVLAIVFLSLFLSHAFTFSVPHKAGISKNGRFTVQFHQQKLGGPLCELCIEQAVALINILLNGILGKGVQTCNELCSYVPAGIEQELCDALCDAVGLYEFIRQLESDDIDPIYYCELIDGCAIDDCNGDCIDISTYVIKPAIAKTGSTVHNVVTGAIKQVWNGTGMLRLIVNFPDGSSDEFDNLISGGIGPVGPFQFDLELSTKSGKGGQGDQYDPGMYSTTLMICNGECGSSYPHSRIFAQAQAKFKLTEK